MNKFLYVARKAKGYSENQIASLLEMEEDSYKEMELELIDLSAQTALRLSKIFEVEPEYFILTPLYHIRQRDKAIYDSLQFMETAHISGLPASTALKTIAFSTQALEIMEQLQVSEYERLVLLKENEAIRKLYQKLKVEIER